MGVGQICSLNMHYVYVLVSLKDRNLYTGYTTNVLKRLDRHNSGAVLATKHRVPFRLVYYEASLERKDAMKREKYLKSAWGKRYIRNRLAEYLRIAPVR